MFYRNICIVFLVVVSLCISTKIEAAESIRTSVLPIHITNVTDTVLLRVLEDEFRGFLDETGKFSVISRSLMKEIMEEKEFQMSSLCDEATCMAEIGRIIGLSHIVAVSVLMDKKDYYVVSAKLVDVQTARVVEIGTERRKGDLYPTIKRILRNLASVLAGEPNKDHRQYLKEEDLEMSEAIGKKEVQLKRFKVSLLGNWNYPIAIFEPDASAKKQRYFDTTDIVDEWSLPKKKLHYDLTLAGGFRLKSRLWLQSRIGFGSSQTIKHGAGGEFESDTTITDNEGSYRMISAHDIESEFHSYYRYFDFGIGLGFEVIRSNRFVLSANAVPEIGVVKYYQREYTTALSNANAFQNGLFLGKILEYSEEIRDVELSGLAMGGDMNLCGEFFIKPRISITSLAGLSWKAVPNLEGESTITRKEISANSGDPEQKVVNETTTEKAAFMKGNWLRTGDYLRIENPDNKTYDHTGNETEKWRHFKEFAHIIYAIGVTVYF